uniref:Actin-related protein 10 n=1 Tax=Mesocestoides corti TaxID=53468 RepID=A0A5K3FMP7_MESCO
MPMYDSIIGEKTAIIFDLGRTYIKCGFAGEPSPRFILSSPFANIDLVKTNLFETLKELFHRMCYKNLIVNAKERRVVIVESLMTPTHFKQSIAEVLFMHFEVPSILFAPSHLAALFTLGISTALVIDCGYSDAVVLPVYEGYTMLNTWQSAQLGSKYIHAELERQLRDFAFFTEEGSDVQQRIPPDTQLPEDLIEDIKVRACFVSPMERSALWNNWLLLTHDGKDLEAVDHIPTPHFATETFSCSLGGSDGRLMHIPSRLRETAVEGLFHGQDADNVTIQSLVLECLLMCPIDCRRELLANIVCIGGTTMLPGFKERLNEELKAALELPRYACLAALKDAILFHDPPAKANYTAWLGGAIFGALESLPLRSLSRATYLENKVLPDWNVVYDFEAVESDVEKKYSR